MDTPIVQNIENFFKQYKRLIYKKGEILIQAENNPSGIFFIKSGMVKQYAISGKGGELVLNIYKPNTFFPMNWAVNKTPNKYYWEAITEVEVWKAPVDEVVTFIKDNPDVIYDLLSRVYRGTDGMLLRMAYLMSGSAYTRLVTEIIIHAKRFGRYKAVPEGSYEIDIAEKDLATRSGMTRETISREMKLLREKGLVTFNKKLLIIHNLEKLEEELYSY
jgi:CRP-like cAMP-binding protein